MVSKLVNEHGTVLIDNEVIANIVCTAAMESYGIVGLAAKNMSDGLYELLGIENMTKGVRVCDKENNSVDIQVQVIMEYGIRISTVAENLIERIRYSVESSTGIKVDEIELIVQGIRV